MCMRAYSVRACACVCRWRDDRDGVDETASLPVGVGGGIKCRVLIYYIVRIVLHKLCLYEYTYMDEKKKTKTLYHIIYSRHRRAAERAERKTPTEYAVNTYIQHFCIFIFFFKFLWKYLPRTSTSLYAHTRIRPCLVERHPIRFSNEKNSFI